MKEPVKNLEYFIGKVVTVITTPINRDFNEQQKCAYFVAEVLAVDQFGIMAKHLATGCRTFFYHTQICAVSEEQVFESPRQEFSEPERQVESPHFNIESLTNLSR